MEQLNFFSFSVISDRLSNRFMNFWNTIVFWNCIVLSFQKRLNMDFEVASFSPLRIFVRDKCLYLRKEVFPHPCLCDLFSSLKCSQYTHKLWSITYFWNTLCIFFKLFSQSPIQATNNFSRSFLHGISSLLKLHFIKQIL